MLSHAAAPLPVGDDHAADLTAAILDDVREEIRLAMAWGYCSRCNTPGHRDDCRIGRRKAWLDRIDDGGER